jgi:DHA2 family multidrug resistance protein-like MFS transporter
VGSAIGPLIGGFLLEHFWWGSAFLLGVPVMVLLLGLGPFLLPEYRDPQAGRLDLFSVVLSLVSVLAVIYGLKQITQHGLGWQHGLFIGAGLALGAVFVRRQRTLADPLIDLRLFRLPAFSASLVTYTLGVFVAFGVFLFVAQYLQLVLGLSPLQAGLWAVPGAITFIIGSNVAPVLVRRVHPAFVIAAGLVLGAVGFGLLTQIGVNSLGLVVAEWGIMSLGFGATFTLTADLVIGAAPPERAGAASALSETGAELGGALGIAVLGSLATAIYHSQVATTLPSGISAEAAKAAQETLAEAVTVAGQLPPQIGTALLGAAHHAFIEGLQLTSVIGVGVMVGLAILALVILRQVGPPSEPEIHTHPKREGLVTFGAGVE